MIDLKRIVAKTLGKQPSAPPPRVSAPRVAKPDALSGLFGNPEERETRRQRAQAPKEFSDQLGNLFGVDREEAEKHGRK